MDTQTLLWLLGGLASFIAGSYVWPWWLQSRADKRNDGFDKQFLKLTKELIEVRAAATLSGSETRVFTQGTVDKMREQIDDILSTREHNFDAQLHAIERGLYDYKLHAAATFATFMQLQATEARIYSSIKRQEEGQDDIRDKIDRLVEHFLAHLK